MIRGTEEFFGGPRLAVVCPLLLVFLAVPLLLGWLGLSGFTVTVTLYVGGALVATVLNARNGGQRRTVRVLVGALFGLVLLLLSGATGIFTFDDQLLWSGASAFTGINLAVLFFVLFVRFPASRT